MDIFTENAFVLATTIFPFKQSPIFQWLVTKNIRSCSFPGEIYTGCSFKVNFHPLLQYMSVSKSFFFQTKTSNILIEQKNLNFLFFIKIKKQNSLVYLNEKGIVYAID